MINHHKKNIKIITFGNFPYGGASSNFLRNFSLALSNNNIEVLLPFGNYYGNKTETDSGRKGHVGKVKYKYIGFIHHPKNYFGKFLDNGQH